MASLRAKVALNFGVRKTRAIRFFYALMTAISFAAMMPTDARAQFTTPCPGAPDLICTNSVDLTGTSFLISAVAGEGITALNTATGIVDNITVNTGSGIATTTNFGIVLGDTLTRSFAGGNAITNNFGMISGVTGLTTESFLGGNATSNNSGTVLAQIATVANDGGAALTINSGNAFSISTSTALIGALVSGPATTINTGTVTSDISTNSDGGGNATTNNAGTVGGLIVTQTTNGGAGFGAGTATTTNSGTADSIINQTFDGGNAVVVNSGTLSGLFGPAGIFNATVTDGTATTINSGTVSGGISTLTGLNSGGGDAVTVNSGKVNGDVTTAAGANGFSGAGNASFVNTGTVDTTSGPFGAVQVVSLGGTASAYNAGKIYGEFDAFAGPGGSAIISNAGLIDGSLFGTAIDLTQSFGGFPNPTIPTTLNILPGSRIIGNIFLNGDLSPGSVGTNVNIFAGRDISSTLTFGSVGCGCVVNGLTDSGSIVTVFGGAPFVIVGNTFSVLDPTSFAVQDKNVADFSHTLSSMITSRLNNPVSISGGSTPIGFAPTGSVAADMARDAFAGISSLNYASSDRVLFSNPSVTASDGTSVWAQGFAGQRIQDADAPTLRSMNNFFGGMIGADKTFRPGLRLGGLLGAGSIKSTIDVNSGDTKSDIVFGGVYGRYAMNQAFMDFALLGGHSGNDLRRNMANNLVPGGIETATADYNGWFISPEFAYGVKMPVGTNLTLTPTARVRYLAAGFGGYQESGATTNLTVASRTSHNFEERGEVTLTHTSDPLPNQRMQISGTFGLLALQRVGDTTVNTILLGQNLPFAMPGQNDVFGVYSGVGFDWRHRNGVTVFGAAEYTATTDSSRTATAKGGVRVAF